MSLSVQDIHASLRFYEALGFRVLDGDVDHNWVVLRNGRATIGLFQGMFDKNVITFHPPDVRSIQNALEAAGIELIQRADPEGSGPAHITCLDPDGNPVLLDQFGADHPQST